MSFNSENNDFLKRKWESQKAHAVLFLGFILYILSRKGFMLSGYTKAISFFVGLSCIYCSFILWQNKVVHIRGQGYCEAKFHKINYYFELIGCLFLACVFFNVS